MSRNELLEIVVFGVVVTGVLCLIVYVVMRAYYNRPLRKMRAANRAWTKRRINEMRQRDGSPSYGELQEILNDPDAYSYLEEKDRAYLEDVSRSVTKKHARELYEKAQRGDADSLEFLTDLVLIDPDHTGAKVSLYWAQTGETYVFPTDWNHLIASIFANPPLEFFAGYLHNPEPGAVRSRAARVLLPGLAWKKQLVDAKIVLAYADARDDEGRYVWRDEIGPVLLAEVSKLVASIHGARNPVVVPAASAE